MNQNNDYSNILLILMIFSLTNLEEDDERTDS